MPPLLRRFNSIGERNYFNCFDAAFGGLLEHHFGDRLLLQKLYGLFDAPSLCVETSDSLITLSRGLDPNAILPRALGYNVERYHSISELHLHRSSVEPFVFVCDEFFVQDYAHFQKKHFCHASFATKATDDSLEAQDPDFLFLTESGFHEVSIRIPPVSLLYPGVVAFYGLEKIAAENPPWNGNYERLIYDISRENLRIWGQGNDHSSPPSVRYYGVRAIEKFADVLLDPSLFENAGSQLWWWIVPLIWKHDFLQSVESVICQQLSKLLSQMSHQMEIAESLMLRLAAKENVNLHNSLIMHWRGIVDVAKASFELESLRVSELEAMLGSRSNR